MVYKPVFRTKMCRYGHNCMSKSNCFYFHDGEERRKNSNLTIPIQVHALNKLIDKLKDKYQILLNEYQIQILQKLVQKANEFSVQDNYFCTKQKCATIKNVLSYIVRLHITHKSSEGKTTILKTCL